MLKELYEWYVLIRDIIFALFLKIKNSMKREISYTEPKKETIKKPKVSKQIERHIIREAIKISEELGYKVTSICSYSREYLEVPETLDDIVDIILERPVASYVELVNQKNKKKDYYLMFTPGGGYGVLGDGYDQRSVDATQVHVRIHDMIRERYLS